MDVGAADDRFLAMVPCKLLVPSNKKLQPLTVDVEAWFFQGAASIEVKNVDNLFAVVEMYKKDSPFSTAATQKLLVGNLQQTPRGGAKERERAHRTLGREGNHPLAGVVAALGWRFHWTAKQHSQDVPSWKAAADRLGRSATQPVPSPSALPSADRQSHGRGAAEEAPYSVQGGEEEEQWPSTPTPRGQNTDASPSVRRSPRNVTHPLRLNLTGISAEVSVRQASFSEDHEPNEGPSTH